MSPGRRDFAIALLADTSKICPQSGFCCSLTVSSEDLSCSSSPPPPPPPPPPPTCQPKIKKNKAYKYKSSALISKTVEKNVNKCLEACTKTKVGVTMESSSTDFSCIIFPRNVLPSTGSRRNASFSKASINFRIRRAGPRLNVVNLINNKLR